MNKEKHTVFEMVVIGIITLATIASIGLCVLGGTLLYKLLNQ